MLKSRWRENCILLLTMACASSALGVTWEEQVRAVAKKNSQESFPVGTWAMEAGNVPEKTFFKKGVPGPVYVDPSHRVISLDLGDAVEFYLPTLPGGMYLVAFRCRTGGPSDVKEPEWFNCSTGVQRGYSVHVDKQEVLMERGLAKPMLAYRGQGWGNWAGWVISRDFVKLRPGSRIRVTSNDSYQYVSDLALLTPAEALACDWLVPDVLTKSLEKPRDVRTRLINLERQTSALEKVQSVELVKSFDAGLQNYCDRLERWKQKFSQAKQKKSKHELNSLAAHRTALIAESDRPLIWVGDVTEEWVSRLLAFAKELPPLPKISDYHARWATILKEWIDIYCHDLQEKPPKESDIDIARRLGRALRLSDLIVRYCSEVKQAGSTKAVSTPVSVEENRQGGNGQPASICLNGLWGFAAGNDPVKPPTKWETIRVPHGPWQEYYGLHYNVGKKWNPNHHVGWYRAKFYVPPSWQGDRLSIRFEAVFYYTEVFANGIYCGNHLGGFDRFSIDVSKAIKPGQMNEMQVMVRDSCDTQTIPQAPNMYISPNYLYVNTAADTILKGNYGGIWQDVYLERHSNRTLIADVAISTQVRDNIRLGVNVAVKNDSDRSQNLVCRFTVLDNTRVVETFDTPSQKIEAKKLCEWSQDKTMKNVKLWGVGGEYGEPYLYRLKTELLENDKVIDIRYDVFGFSQLWIKGNKFVLNDKPIFLAGGGTWYLQEIKFPLGNRFYAEHLFRMDRGANINLERIHRQGDATESYYQEASEMGMLLEPECAGMIPMFDAYGNADYADPVKMKTSTDYYRSFAAKHQNYPCTVLLTVENESFSHQVNEELMQMYLKMVEVVGEEDPLRICDFHGNHMMADHKGVPFVNLHYYNADTLPNWHKTAAGRPIINGEHNGSGYFISNNQDRTVAAKGEQVYADFWRKEINGYRQSDAAGLFMFISALGAYCSTSSWEKTTPWGDCFKDLSKCTKGDDIFPANFNTTVDVTWPSLSGPDTKGEKVSVSTVFCTINWFDPARPVATPTKTYDAMKESFPLMKPCNIQRCQEALITVKSDGRPVIGATVMLFPLESQPVIDLGAITDPAGTAWIVPRLTGKYRVTVWAPDGRQKESSISLGRYVADRAGYDKCLVQVNIDLQ